MPETLSDPSHSQRYYSSTQIAVATLIGGPLAGGYLASRDHALFGHPEKGRIILIISCVAIIALLYLGSIVPPQASRTALPFIAVIAYRVYATYAFDPTIAQRKSEGWLQYPWWRAVGSRWPFLSPCLFSCSSRSPCSTFRTDCASV